MVRGSKSNMLGGVWQHGFREGEVGFATLDCGHTTKIRFRDGWNNIVPSEMLYPRPPLLGNGSTRLLVLGGSHVGDEVTFIKWSGSGPSKADYCHLHYAAVKSNLTNSIYSVPFKRLAELAPDVYSMSFSRLKELGHNPIEILSISAIDRELSTPFLQFLSDNELSGVPVVKGMPDFSNWVIPKTLS
jgi:hypothetical protein